MGIPGKAAPPPSKIVLHGTAVLMKGAGFEPAAVLIRGLSGAGKSDLAFRLIEAGAELICDDQVELEKRQEKVFAGSVSAIEGLLEVRGIGLVRYDVAPQSRLRLVVDLVKREDVPRLPEAETIEILDIEIPRLRLHGFDGSTPLKVAKALEVLQRPSLVVR